MKSIAQSRNIKRMRRHTKIRSQICGTLSRPRISVYRSLVHMYVQIIDDTNSRTLVSFDDRVLSAEQKKKKPLEQARILGEEVGKLAKNKGISSVVFDRGGYAYTGRIKALADGIRSQGINF